MILCSWEGGENDGVVNSNIYDYYKHNGETIYVHWQLSADEIDNYKTTYSERIEFTYKDINVIEFYKQRESHWYKITKLMCDMIDKLGKEKFNQFKKYYEEYKSLEEEYIIINNNVYKPYINDNINITLIEMEDGKRLDGRTNINQQGMKPFDTEEIISILKYRVKEYFKNNNILPKEKYLLKKKTEQYKKIVEWFDENEIII